MISICNKVVACVKDIIAIQEKAFAGISLRGLLSEAVAAAEYHHGIVFAETCQ